MNVSVAKSSPSVGNVQVYTGGNLESVPISNSHAEASKAISVSSQAPVSPQQGPLVNPRQVPSAHLQPHPLQDGILI